MQQSEKGQANRQGERPEAEMAGALDIQLGGINFYDGLPHEGSRIGDGARAPRSHDIDVAVRIAVAACGLGFFLAVVYLWIA